MRRATAKHFGPVESSQKKITQFFVKKPENNNTSKSESSNEKQLQPQLKNNAKKRNANTASLKRPHASGSIDCIDLADSDEDSSWDLLQFSSPEPTPSTSSRSVGGADGKRTLSVIIGPPPVGDGMQTPIGNDVKAFRKVSAETSRSEERGRSKRKALRVKNEVEDLEQDVYEQFSPEVEIGNLEEESAKVANGDSGLNNTDGSTDGLIRIVPFSKILEDPQSSVEDGETQSFAGNDKETQRLLSSTRSCDFGSEDDAPYSLQSSIFLSPMKKAPRNANSASASPTTRKTPIKSPKTRVNHLSPIRQLKYKSRSLSRTPTKNPSASTSASQNSPFRNAAVSSPLKSLWASAPVPYYLKNFTTVLNSVVGDEHYSYLLNEVDMDIIQKFHCLSKNAQCLYVRLIGRKWDWKKASQLSYDQIDPNLAPVLQELHTHKFLHEISEVAVNLEDILDLISHDRMAVLCKEMNIKVPNNCKTKEKCIPFLLKNCQQQQTLTGSMTANLKKAALKEVQPAYKVTEVSKSLFSRIFILYHPPQYWEQESDKDALQLLSILLAELGKVEYPQYKIYKSQRIYEDRNDLLRFQEAWVLHSQIQAHILSKQWEEVAAVAKEAMVKLKELLEVPSIVEFSQKLPDHLRAYVAGSLLTRICWLGVDGFQKLRDYKIANEYLNFLLNQNTYLTHYHGRWYERLVLNSKHLREDNVKIREIIQSALSAPNVRDSYKLDLFARLAKLKVVVAGKKKRKGKKRKPKRKPKRKKDTEEWESSDSTSSQEDSSEEDEEIDVSPCESYSLRHVAPERTIEGEKMPLFDREHGKSIFIGAGTGNRSLSSVEQVAMKFYESQGYDYCIHAEGAVPSTIYGLLFWTIIYNDEIPDVFHSPYQALPLDLNSDEFRVRRQPTMDEMLQNLRSNWDCEVALKLMERNWVDNINKLSIVNWTLFESFEQLKILVRSMGLPLVAGICDRLSQNYSHYRSGFPDLIVWGENKCRFAEVKGPGDSLSAKQRLWIDYLLSLEADVEVCHVKSVSNKRIRIV